MKKAQRKNDKQQKEIVNCRAQKEMVEKNKTLREIKTTFDAAKNRIASMKTQLVTNRLGKPFFSGTVICLKMKWSGTSRVNWIN